MTKKKIEKALADIGEKPFKIVFYDTTDSTNTRAKEYAKQSTERENLIFVANHQTNGRGRLGRSFVSNEGAGIYLSILTYPDESGADATAVTARAAVALARAIDSLAGTKTQIKWVNDIVLGGKKLAGILTESEMLENGKIGYLVVGMGINVYKNAISEEISDIATSIESEVGSAPDRSRLVAKIISEFFRESNDYLDEYRARSLVIGKKVTVIKPTEQYEATVVGINDDFSLQIQRDGKEERLFTGEISIRI